jgi:hypothetical protein
MQQTVTFASPGITRINCCNSSQNIQRPSPKVSTAHSAVASIIMIDATVTQQSTDEFGEYGGIGGIGPGLQKKQKTINHFS